MNMFAKALWRAAKWAGAHPRDPLLAEWMGAGARTSSGQSVTADSAMQVPAVFACVRVIADTIASLPCIVYRVLEDGKERDPEHPLYRLLHDRPNRWQTSTEWLRQMVAHLLLRGNAYSQKLASPRSALTELIPLNPTRVRPVLLDPEGRVLQEVSPEARLVYWYTPLYGAPRVILQSEMLHIRLTRHSASAVVGVSPIELHREAIGLSMAAQEYGARFFENDAKPGGGVKIPGTFKDEEAIKRFRRKWQEAQGGENRHSVAVFEGGAEWVDIGLSNKDSQFLETRKYQVADIARIYGVPLHMIGELDKATFSNIEQQSMEFVRDTIRPYLTLFEQAFRRDLFDVEDWLESHTAEFLAEALLRGDTQTRFNAYAVGRQWGWLSANDIRRLENMNPIDGGDQYLSPMNMVDPTKKPQENPAEPKNDPAADEDEDDEAKPEKGKSNGQARSFQ